MVIKISRLQAPFWEECWSRWSLYATGIGVDVGTLRAALEDGTTGRSGTTYTGDGDGSSCISVFIRFCFVNYSDLQIVRESKIFHSP